MPAPPQLPLALQRLCRPRSALLGGDQIVHCRGDAALAVWHTRQFERHLHCRQGSEDHRLVQIAEMADAEDVPLEPVESSTERNVELVEAELAHLVGVIAV